MTDTRITGPLIPPLPSKGDAVDKPDAEQKRERHHGQKQNKPETPPEDAMSFSLGAIRALLQQEGVTDPAIFAALGRLEAKGVASLSLATGQDILAAIKDADNL